MKNNTVDRKWIEQKMRDAGIRSAAELGRCIGINERSMMTHIFNGTRNIQEDALLEMSKVLHVPVRDLAQKLGGRRLKMVKAIEETDALRLQVKGTIDDRFTVFFFPESHPSEQVKIDIKTGVGAFALKYETANTAASMFDGSIAVILEKRAVEDAAMLDRNNVVWLADGKVLVRRVTKGQLADRYNLDGANVPPLYDVEILAFAPVQALVLPSRKKS